MCPNNFSDYHKRLNPHQSSNHTPKGSSLEVGRVLINYPCYARLEVYEKKDNRRGASVTSQMDGAVYGVTRPVLEYFRASSQYYGWAYVDNRLHVVFSFLEGEKSPAPAALWAIETSDGRVDIKNPEITKDLPEDGMWVAFFAFATYDPSTRKQKRQAKDVYPLDQDHVLVIARLITNGKLAFPLHNEVVQLFLDALESAPTQTRDQANLLESALTALASSPHVPGDLQTLARVERTRRHPSSFGRHKPVRPVQTVSRTAAAPPAAVSRQQLAKEYSDVPAGQINPINFRLDKE